VGATASPRKSAQTDHANAAIVPSEMSVSMVAAAWRRFAHAALWNGQPPQVTTGAASAKHSHCQLSNCRRGIIDSARIGTVSTVQATRRSRRCRMRTSCSSCAAGEPAAAGTVAGGVRVAV
jgi:hypothetical protein